MAACMCAGYDGYKLLISKRIELVDHTGIEPVPHECHVGRNRASAAMTVSKTIERSGGILENVVSGPDLAKAIRHYWIDLERVERA